MLKNSDSHLSDSSRRLPSSRRSSKVASIGSFQASGRPALVAARPAVRSIPESDCPPSIGWLRPASSQLARRDRRVAANLAADAATSPRAARDRLRPETRRRDGASRRCHRTAANIAGSSVPRAANRPTSHLSCKSSIVMPVGCDVSRQGNSTLASRTWSPASAGAVKSTDCSVSVPDVEQSLSGLAAVADQDAVPCPNSPPRIAAPGTSSRNHGSAAASGRFCSCQVSCCRPCSLVSASEKLAGAGRGFAARPVSSCPSTEIGGNPTRHAARIDLSVEPGEPPPSGRSPFLRRAPCRRRRELRHRSATRVWLALLPRAALPSSPLFSNGRAHPASSCHPAAPRDRPPAARFRSRPGCSRLLDQRQRRAIHANCFDGRQRLPSGVADVDPRERRRR